LTLATSSALAVDSNLYQSMMGLSFSHDGSYIAVAADAPETGSAPGTVNIRSVSTKAMYANYQQTTYKPQSIAFSPAGNALVVGEYHCGKVLLCTN